MCFVEDVHMSIEFPSMYKYQNFSVYFLFGAFVIETNTKTIRITQTRPNEIDGLILHLFWILLHFHYYVWSYFSPWNHCVIR